MDNEQLEYAGFWVRVGAALIDTLLLLLITMPLLYWIYGEYLFTSEDFIVGGWDFLISWVLPFIATVLFWVYRSATPGKIALKLQVVNADTGLPLTPGKSVLRYVAYYVSIIPLCLGFIWVAFSSKKQGWHDLIAKTVVVRTPRAGIDSVNFSKRSE
ncbi:RDD family protein [Vibrio sp. YMD68]|uniref:RDD family protein n=1 Tax=Vibrio sp. YMD68 TaxID=3042300 RepID=UPI00249AE30D|nr:RDD family protein [Vibrio sp. YMD68]WGV97924.1 RDD family protein [Vibrio sp. YMD68]